MSNAVAVGAQAAVGLNARQTARPLFVAMAATAWHQRYAPSPVALALAGNDGGERAVLVLGKA